MDVKGYVKDMLCLFYPAKSPKLKILTSILMNYQTIMSHEFIKLMSHMFFNNFKLEQRGNFPQQNGWNEGIFKNFQIL